LLFPDKTVDFTGGCKVWRANSNSRVIADLQRNRFSSFSASFNGIVDIHENVSCKILVAGFPAGRLISIMDILIYSAFCLFVCI
jgi:hypothetical protein